MDCGVKLRSELFTSMHSTDTAHHVSFEHGGVHFVVMPELCFWIEAQVGTAYWFQYAEAIVNETSSTIDLCRAEQVELYGVPLTGRVYAKIFDAGSIWQQEWDLQFTEGMAWVSRRG